MGETSRSFDPEFRAGAVRIVRETGKSIALAAKDLGVNAGTPANWMQMGRLARERSATGELTESEREESTRLRRQRAEWAFVDEVLALIPVEKYTTDVPGSTLVLWHTCDERERRGERTIC
jgi:transposase